METKKNVRNPGLCMVHCNRHKLCMYWNYEKATKNCFLLSVCGKVLNTYLQAYKHEISFEGLMKEGAGWITGAKKCQTIEETIDDRGNVLYVAYLIQGLFKPFF